MFCPHCGTNNAGGQFCAKCGSALNTQASGVQASSTVPLGQPATQVANGFSHAAIALGSIAFLFFPVVFGPVGIVLAVVGKGKNEPKATIGLTVAILGTVMGMLIGYLSAA
jgi:hypothetical protein